MNNLVVDAEIAKASTVSLVLSWSKEPPIRDSSGSIPFQPFIPQVHPNGLD